MCLINHCGCKGTKLKFSKLQQLPSNTLPYSLLTFRCENKLFVRRSLSTALQTNAAHIRGVHLSTKGLIRNMRFVLGGNTHTVSSREIGCHRFHAKTFSA